MSLRRVCLPSHDPLRPARPESSRSAPRPTLRRAALVGFAALCLGLWAGPDVALAQTRSSGRSSPAKAPTQALGPVTQLEGTLEVLHEDWPTGSRDFYFLESTAGERLSLHFAANPPRHLLTGTKIKVKGVRVGQTLKLDSGGTSIQPMATTSATSPMILPNTLGAQRTLVILLNFQNNPIQPWTPDAARSAFFGTTSNFFLEASYSQTWLSGDVFGWYTIPMDDTACDQRINNYADQAAIADGATLSNYTHLVYVFPVNRSCGYSGSSTVGGSPSRSWINGSLDLYITGHELGHALGLFHSHSLACTDGTSMGPNCSAVEYGDGTDIMGWSNGAHFNAFQKERLGWLNYGVSPPITTVETTGTYALDPYAPPGSEPKALKILKSTDPTTGLSDWYYVEFRQAIGFDSVIQTDSRMNSSNILNGVEIRWGREASGSWLLDMTPETYDLYSRDPALTVGRSFSDPDAGVAIALASVGSTGAAVTVALSPPDCPRANPTVTVSPTSQTVSAGTAATYTVSVTNNDGASCAATSFRLQAGTGGLIGWTASLAASTLTLGPGANALTTLTLTSPASATSSYTFPVAVTNSANTSYSAWRSVGYVIGSALNVSVSTDRSSYTGSQTVSVTARASSAGSPTSNASVTFTMTKSNGTVVSQTATTDSTGSAVGKFRLKRQDPVGAYNARADAAKTPMSGSATTSFTVVK